jgi:hypothetical protein
MQQESGAEQTMNSLFIPGECNNICSGRIVFFSLTQINERGRNVYSEQEFEYFGKSYLMCF